MIPRLAIAIPSQKGKETEKRQLPEVSGIAVIRALVPMIRRQSPVSYWLDLSHNRRDVKLNQLPQHGRQPRVFDIAVSLPLDGGSLQVQRADKPTGYILTVRLYRTAQGYLGAAPTPDLTPINLYSLSL